MSAALLAPPLERDALEQLLPHRRPALLLARATAFERGQSLDAVRTFEPGDPLFAGHFPGLAILPGVHLFEAMAQGAALLFVLTYGQLADDELPVLGSVDGRLLAPVFPGDTIAIQVDAEKMTSTAGIFRARVRAGEREVARATLSLAKSSTSRLAAAAAGAVELP